ncbi:MAG TPA: hypothetical protein PKD16_19635 [Saprospiraceae bacterium]|jgi:hypothetical protein|nr:hypothetical protein [Saprospiraceae bacterium]HMT53819.1 hypothetical protein [Saprospiraceae bacterium]HMT72386.1 hypothetical protein [Saprospiraceae bacterium]
MKYLLSIIIISFIFSCKKPKIVTTSSGQGKENFDTFFEKFKNDSVFQKQRIKYPFKMAFFEAELENPDIEYYNKDNITYLNLKYKEEFAKKEIDAYTQDVKFYKDTARIELRGVDNGIFIDVDFIPINGIWFCIQLIDSST